MLKGPWVNGYKMFSKWFKLSAIWLCKESRGKKAVTLSLNSLSLTSSYIRCVPEQAAIGSDFYDLDIMYIKGNESLTTQYKRSSIVGHVTQYSINRVYFFF